MNDYKITLYTDDSVTDRKVNQWIVAWNDSAGGRWENLQQETNTRWTLTLEANRIEPEIKGVIDHTISLDDGLADWAYSEV